MTSVDEVLRVLADVIDPDVGLNVVDLGLVEVVDVAPGRVRVGLIMTTPACPQSSYLRDEAAMRLEAALDRDTAVEVEVLDEPFWQPDRMSEVARDVMGWGR